MSEDRALVYYLPGRSSLSRRGVEEVGLGYLLDGKGGPGPTLVGCAGPDGGNGVAFTIAGRRGRGGHDRPGDLAQKAEWSPIPGTPAWVGVVEGARPGPEDLERADLIPGHEVELGDGRGWTVPVVRLLDGGSNLPRPIRWNGHAWLQGDVRPVYRSLWAAGLRMWDTIVGAQEGEAVTFSEEATTAAAAIALNYRVGPAEISALELFDTRNEVEVLKALIDLPALDALRGKVGAAGPL